MKFTVLGANGFIGSHLVSYLKEQNHECYTPDIRKENLSNENLGNVIYAIGVSDFLNKPLETIDAHVCILNQILKKSDFDSLLYLSSGRIYYNTSSTTEDEIVTVDPTSLDDLYNISKIMGESICMAFKRKKIKIVRPSNVLGIGAPENLFIPSIISDAVKNNKIILNSTLDSEKDYVDVDDLVTLIPKILLDGKYDIYNIASGYNTKTRDIVNEIVKLTDCKVEIKKDAKEFSFPKICVDKIKNEFNFTPIPVVNQIKKMITEYQKN
jgi:nucleoside-diphosphate-sugar epimerase